MIGLLLAVAVVAPAQAGCDDAEEFVALAEQAVLEDRISDAIVALRDAEVAFSCGPVVDKVLLVRFWLAQGARETKDGDVRAAAVSFRSASMLAPDPWPVDYGIKPSIQYKAAAELWLGEGSIQLHPDPGSRVTALDGELVSFPAPALEGLHLVQIGQSADEMEFAALVRVMADEPTMVLTELEVAREDAVAAAVDPDPIIQRDRRGLRVGSLVVGGSAAVLAGGAAYMARAQDDVMREQSTQAELDAIYARQQGYAAATWGLAGLSAVGLTLHFVF